MRRALILLAIALAAGGVCGSGLAALADPRPSDACANYDTLPEGLSSYRSRTWPVGTRCVFVIDGRSVSSARFWPTLGGLLASIVLVTLFAAFVLRKRDSAAARGAAAAATLLALAGLFWQYGGINFAVLGAIFLGPPLVLTIDLLLRPRGTRALATSARTAIALPAPAFCAFLVFLFVGIEPAGVVLGILSGALVSARLARWERPRLDLLPSV